MTSASSIQTENLAGKRALVRGGTRGTGAAVAARLKGAGAHVTATGRAAIVDSSRRTLGRAVVDPSPSALSRPTPRPGWHSVRGVKGGQGAARSGDSVTS